MKIKHFYLVLCNTFTKDKVSKSRPKLSPCNLFHFISTNLWYTLKCLLLEIETISQESASGSFKEYYQLLRKWLVYFQKMVQDYRFQQWDMVNQDEPILSINQGNYCTSFHPKLLYLKPLVDSLELFIQSHW